MQYNNQIGSGWAAASFLGGIIAIMSCAANTATAGTIHVPGDHLSIQAAIDAAVDGDEIIVAPGTYDETINFNGKAVHLRSSDGPEVTIIDATGIAPGQGSVVLAISGEGPLTVLEGFTITGGTGSDAYPGDDDLRGGGMFIWDSSPTVTNCIFTGNSADYGGGLFNLFNSGTVITNCTFQGNTATVNGGGMMNAPWGSSPTVTGCTFLANHAGLFGGGMANVFADDPEITDCIFEANTAARGGGAMHNFESSPNVTTCSFVQNSSTQSFNIDGGGAVYNHGSSPTFTNCQFIENHVEVSFEFTGGGAVRNQSGSNPTFTNCTFEGNTAFGTAESSGGAMFNSEGSNVELQNCTFTGNQADWDGAMGSEFESSVVAHGCVFSQNEAMVGGAGAYGHFEGGTALFNNCQFVGNSVVTSGGAMQLSQCSVTFVNCHFSDNVASNFCGGAIVNVQATLHIDGCLFDNNYSGLGAGAVCSLDNSDVTLANAIFTNNAAPFAGALYSGGATSSNLTVSNCAFQGNFTVSTGGDNAGGAFVTNNGSTATFTDSTFIANASATVGGAVGFNDAQVSFNNCVFTGNTSSGAGGGAYSNNFAEAAFIDCQFWDNSSIGPGGGAFLTDNSVGTFTNCLFASNHAGAGFNGGGILVRVDSFAQIINCTFAQNTAQTGGGLRLGVGGSADVRNSILWNNLPNQITTQAGAGPLSVRFSNIQGGWLGVGNINANPLFVDAANGDFRLSAGSPSIDAGDNFAVPDGIDTDLDGNPRFVDDPDTPDTGNGAPGDAIVDMGAYEFQVPSVPSCPGDLTGNGSVGVADLLALLACWGPVDPAPGNECEAADLTGSNNVGVADLLDLLSQWGPCPR